MSTSEREILPVLPQQPVPQQGRNRGRPLKDARDYEGVNCRARTETLPTKQGLKSRYTLPALLTQGLGGVHWCLHAWKSGINMPLSGCVGLMPLGPMPRSPLAAWPTHI